MKNLITKEKLSIIKEYKKVISQINTCRNEAQNYLDKEEASMAVSKHKEILGIKNHPDFLKLMYSFEESLIKIKEYIVSISRADEFPCIMYYDFAEGSNGSIESIRTIEQEIHAVLRFKTE